VREAVFAGRYAEADALAKKMQGPYNQSYQPLGDLLVDFDVEGEPEDYRRELDLDRAVATTTFRAGGTVHTREAFASFPDQVIVLRVSATALQVSFTARSAASCGTPRSRGATRPRCAAGPRATSTELPRREEAPVRYDEGPDAEACASPRS
jgi:hypothetical protein